MISKKVFMRKILKHKPTTNISFFELLYIGETGIKFLDWLSDTYHSIKNFFSNKKEMLQRMMFWGWKMRNSYDFDASTIYEIIYYKLDRIYLCFLNHSHCLWNNNSNTPGMRKLRIARELAKRLSENYYTQNYDDFCIKYPFQGFCVPMSEKQRAAFIYATKKDTYLRNRDKEYLFNLLKKHIDYFWD